MAWLCENMEHNEHVIGLLETGASSITHRMKQRFLCAAIADRNGSRRNVGHSYKGYRKCRSAHSQIEDDEWKCGS